MFKSSVLLESQDSNISIHNHDNDIQTYSENVLELNDKLHEIDLQEKINYYRSLKEDSLNESTELVLRENIVSSIRDAITKAIDAIIAFIKRFVNTIRSIYNSKVRNDFQEFRRTNPNSYANMAERMNERRNYKFFYYPNLNEIDDNTCVRAVQYIVNDIDRICNGENKDYTVSEQTLNSAFAMLARLALKNRSRKEFTGSCKTMESFKELVQSDIVYIEEREATYIEHYNFHKDKSAISVQTDNIVAKKLSLITSELEECKSKVRNATNIDESQRKNLNDLVSQINQIIAAWTWYLNLICAMEVRLIRYLINAKHNIMNESGSIHGEPFNSETLFANEDIRDFGSTEWLDLSLKTEVFEIKSEMLECERRIAVNEAMILSDNSIDKFNQLVSMRESEEKKLSTSIQSIMQKIKELALKFLAKLQDTLNGNTLFLKKYNEATSKPFGFKDVSSTGDILAGMNRVQQSIKLVPFDYESMKESLSSKEEFFKKYILPSLNTTSPLSKRKVEWKDGMKITDYCKAYFGSNMPEDQYQKCVYNNDELNSSKTSILNFLKSSHGVTNSINAELRALEIESKKAASFTANPTQSQNNANNSASSNAKETSTQESYYSELYDCWFTEAEINNDENMNKNNNDNSSESGTKTSDKSAAFKIYIDCYRDVIMSKLTAVEFIYRELMQIIKVHAIANMSKEEKEAYNKYKNNEENNENQATSQT